ncbi:hypothetical protein F5X99DRAFT_377692, partial [Biscogniauxia marginata]
MSSPQGETPASQQEQPTQTTPATTPPAGSPSLTPTASPAQAAQARQSGQPERLAEAARQTQNAHLTQTAPDWQLSQPSGQSSQDIQQGQDVPATVAPQVAPTAQGPGQPQGSPTHQSPIPNAPQAPPLAQPRVPFAAPAQHSDQPPQQAQQGQQAPWPQPPRPQEQPYRGSNSYPLYRPHQDMKRNQLYAMLGALDPYRVTPKEFIHLLVEAGLHDEDIYRSIYRMNEERLQNPQYWNPVRGLPGPGQPLPQPYQQQQPPPPPQQHPQPYKVPRPIAPAPSPCPPQVIYYAPQNPPFYPQAISNAPPPSTIVLPHSPQEPIPSHQTSPSQSESSIGPVVPAQRPGPAVDDGATTAAGNTNDSAIELDDEPAEPSEQPCNFTWVVNRVEVHLGWTGNWDKMSETRQTNIGYTVAFKLQKLQRKMNAMMDKYLSFPNRVHILTVMRELMAATLETDSRVGRECRECAREYDDNFVEAVRKLTPAQRRRLKVLEGGKWVQELQELVDEAKRQSLFRRLEQALVCID